LRLTKSAFTGVPGQASPAADQRLRDQTGLIEKRGFSAHRSSIEGREEETEIRAADIDGRENDQGHPPRNAQAPFCGRQNPYRAGGVRGEDSIAAICRPEGIADAAKPTCSNAKGSNETPSNSAA